MTDLLDGNVLVALTSPSHVHHALVAAWFTGQADPFATSPITQGTLLRVLIRAGASATEAAGVLDGVRSHPRHVFWSDDLPYDNEVLRRVAGHGGVTDAYLVALARANGGRVITLDLALAATYPESSEGIPVLPG